MTCHLFLMNKLSDTLANPILLSISAEKADRVATFKLKNMDLRPC
jgi:hypothetical protein